MSTQHKRWAGPSGRDSRARLGAVKAPREARPRSRRAVGLDRACGEPQMASVDGPAGPWPIGSPGGEVAATTTTGAPSILVTIGQQTRIFHAFVTAASARLDAPSTVTLYVSTLADLAGFADDVTLEPAAAARPARLVLIDAMEFTWQRARCREAGHRLIRVDARFVGPAALERWLWRRLLRPEMSTVSASA